MDIYLADVPSGNISIFTKEKPDKINDLYDFIYKEEETYPMKKTRFHEDYYGITWAKGRLFVTHGEWPSSLLEYDSSGKILNRFLPPKNHIQMFRAHQITSIDNHIIITSTLNDTLFRFDIKTEEWDYFSIIESNFKRIYAPDKHHLNSVWYSDKKLYLILNNKGESALNIYDYPQMSLIESKILGQKVHNVWKMKDQIWFCNSGDGTVRSEKGEKITVEECLKDCGAKVGDQLPVLSAASRKIILQNNKSAIRNERFWREKLNEVRPLSLSSGMLREGTQISEPYERLRVPIPSEIDSGATKAQSEYLMAAWGVFVARITGQESFDMEFLPLKNEENSDFDSRLFSTSLPFRFDIEPHETFLSILEKTSPNKGASSTSSN